jgi:hypothetical protein
MKVKILDIEFGSCNKIDKSLNVNGKIVWLFHQFKYNPKVTLFLDSFIKESLSESNLCTLELIVEIEKEIQLNLYDPIQNEYIFNGVLSVKNNPTWKLW